jgi:gluconolactonase
MRRSTDLPLGTKLGALVASLLMACSTESDADATPKAPPAGTVNRSSNVASVVEHLNPPLSPPGPTPATGSGSAASGGRVGSERCPMGPFNTPLPPSPSVQKLLSPPPGTTGALSWEGAVWIGDSLYWSEISSGEGAPPARIHRFTPGSKSFTPGLIQNTGSNGLAVDAQGNLVAATHDTGGISTFTLSTGARGQFAGPNAQTFNGQRFISPNDLVLRSDGNLYFTDPRFRAPAQSSQGNVTRVYRVSPEGVVSVVEAGLTNPNGITLSPDGSTLYVSASSGTGLRSYALDASGAPSSGADVPLNPPLEAPDGMAVDCAGNIYATEHEARRITVLTGQGELIGSFGGRSVFDSDINNLAFGGADGRTLFVTTAVEGTARGGLYAVQLGVPGLPY